MSKIQVIANKCDTCGHVWLSKEEPKRCAQCKSRKWNVRGVPPELQAGLLFGKLPTATELGKDDPED